MRILAVDPGETNIGIAISDATGTIGNPLTIIRHKSRENDADRIAQLITVHDVKLIIVGQALDEEGFPSYQGRKAVRLAAVIRKKTHIPVQLWDESYSTNDAISAQNSLGISHRRKKGRIDDLAATVILQSYLDSRSKKT